MLGGNSLHAVTSVAKQLEIIEMVAMVLEVSAKESTWELR